MATATQSEPIQAIKRRRKLTETDYRALMDLFGCDVSSEIPQKVVEACLNRQAKWHAIASGPLPEKELKAAMAECGYHAVGRLIQRPVMQEVPVIDDHDDLKGEMDLAGSDDLTDSPALTVKEAEKVEEAKVPKSKNPWKDVEKGVSVVCEVETEKGLKWKRGRFAGLGAGGRPMVTIIGADKPTLITRRIELEAVPGEGE